MIRIGRPVVESDASWSRLVATVDVDASAWRRYIEATASLVHCAWLTSVDYPPSSWSPRGGPLEYRVPSEYAGFLCSERSDAFVVAMLWYAVLTGSDIVFSEPLSKRLYDGLTTAVIPALAGTRFRRIGLTGPVTDSPLPCAGAVGSGMSCGADSFYTLETHGAGSGLPLTHLAYFSAGDLIPFGATEVEKTYHGLSETTAGIMRHAKAVADAAGLPFVPVYTNLDRDFYRGGVIYTAMYRYLSCTLALGKLFGVFVSSSSGHGGDLAAGLLMPTQNYEELICANCRTETLNYVSSDDVSRPEKLRLIADNELFQRYASVCFNNNACGECIGCWKTMFPLDILGKLDRFGGIFDLSRYYAHREEYVRAFVGYAAKPELVSVRETLAQLVRLADSETGESALIFRKLFSACRDCGKME